MAIDAAGGSLYVAGFDNTPGTNDTAWRIERVSLGDGPDVRAFGEGGAVLANPSPRHDWIEAIALDGASGCLFAAGCDGARGYAQWRVEKRDAATGRLVEGFGGGGVLQIDPSPGNDFVAAVGCDGDGFLYLAGSQFFGDQPRGHASPDHEHRETQDGWRIEKRRASDGALVPGFGQGGVILGDHSPLNDEINAMAIDPAGGCLYAAGWDRCQGDENRQWRLEKRRLDNGAPVADFGQGGAVTDNPSGRNDVIACLALDPAGGVLYAAGYDNSTGKKQWRIQKRRMSDGSLVGGFGEGGTIAFNPSPHHDVPKAIALDAAGGFFFLGGVSREPRDGQWRIEKRRCADGGRDPAFGDAGVILQDPNPTANDEVRAMALDPAAGLLYLTGFQSRKGDRAWRTERRDMSDGRLVPGEGWRD